MKSPITLKNNTIIEKEMPSSYIVERYKKKLDVDVSRFLESIDKISIHKCLDTGYRFYHPFTLSGDNSFYQRLEKFPWYYMDWKWEHGIAENFIKEGDKVLEIGCANGSFLKKIKEKGALVEGLEMNFRALERAKNNGLTVYPDSIEKFSINHKNIYDVVCSFQVLEHIADIKAFIEASLSVLKPGGLMIISVPNNDCLMFEGENIILNMPPHHMGMWNMNSLIKLQEYFGMKLDSVHLEPLQKYHLGFANKIADKKINEKLEQKMGPFSFLLKNLAKRFGYLGISAVSDNIIGHSILVTFRKEYDK